MLKWYERRKYVGYTWRFKDAWHITATKDGKSGLDNPEPVFINIAKDGRSASILANQVTVKMEALYFFQMLEH
jgi:hypothetical protein